MGWSNGNGRWVRSGVLGFINSHYIAQDFGSEGGIMLRRAETLGQEKINGWVRFEMAWDGNIWDDDSWSLWQFWG
jgi:hypothetical protein